MRVTPANLQTSIKFASAKLWWPSSSFLVLLCLDASVWNSTMAYNLKINSHNFFPDIRLNIFESSLTGTSGKLRKLWGKVQDFIYASNGIVKRKSSSSPRNNTWRRQKTGWAVGMVYFGAAFCRTWPSWGGKNAAEHFFEGMQSPQNHLNKVDQSVQRFWNILFYSGVYNSLII